MYLTILYIYLGPKQIRNDEAHVYLQIADSFFNFCVAPNSRISLSLSIVCFSAVCPPACREAHSDGAQSVCRAVASSLEAFQLLQGDLTKISCPLLNYNLPSASVLSLPCSIFLHFGQKNRSPSLFRCQLICAFVCA